VSKRGDALSADAIERYTQLALERGGVVVGHKRFDAPTPVEEVDEDTAEKEFQQWVTDRADENKWQWHHQTNSRRSKSGWLDLTLWHEVRRLLLFREVKTETGIVSAAQASMIDSLTAAGLDAGVWRPSMQVEIVRILSVP
jgi:hypothetical protein